MKWSDEEIQVLTEICKQGCTVKQALKVFPNRTIHSIQSKCSFLGLSLEGVKPVIDYEEFKKLVSITKII